MTSRRKQQQSPQLNQASWESNFPGKQDSEDNRLKFLARMGYIALAHYLLYRNIVPISVFIRRRVEDVHVYRFNTETRWGHKLAGMIEGLKDAVMKKYAASAFIMINEDKENPNAATEVFTIRFCYSKVHSVSVVNDEGQPIITMQYKNEKAFRSQAKHLIKKMRAVTKKLKKLNVEARPYMKLTYYPETPEDYEPANFIYCKETYNFDSKPVFFDYGYTSTQHTAVGFHLESTYVKKTEVSALHDAIFEEEKLLKDQQEIDPRNVSKVCDTDEYEEEEYFNVPVTPERIRHTTSTKSVDEPQADDDGEDEVVNESITHVEHIDEEGQNVDEPMEMQEATDETAHQTLEVELDNVQTQEIEVDTDQTLEVEMDIVQTQEIEVDTDQTLEVELDIVQTQEIEVDTDQTLEVEVPREGVPPVPIEVADVMSQDDGQDLEQDDTLETPTKLIESMGPQEEFTPSPSPQPTTRQVTPRLEGSARKYPMFKPKASVNMRDVMQSPEDNYNYGAIAN